MSDYWTGIAMKLQAELAAAGIELNAADDVIAANAGGWFAAMSANEKESVVATMRNLAAQVSTGADLRKHTVTFGKTVDAHKGLAQSYQKMGVTAAEFDDLQPNP